MGESRGTWLTQIGSPGCAYYFQCLTVLVWHQDRYPVCRKVFSSNLRTFEVVCLLHMLREMCKVQFRCTTRLCGMRCQAADVLGPLVLKFAVAPVSLAYAHIRSYSVTLTVKARWVGSLATIALEPYSLF